MKAKKLGLAAASLLGAATMLGAAAPAHADVACLPGVCDGHPGGDPMFKVPAALTSVLGKWSPEDTQFVKIDAVLQKITEKW